MKNMLLDHETVEEGPDPLDQEQDNNVPQAEAHEAGAAQNEETAPNSDQAGAEAGATEMQGGEQGPPQPRPRGDIHLSDYENLDAQAEAPPIYAESGTDLIEGAGLHIKVELNRESDRIVSARAGLDLTRKARLEIPTDWPDLPQDLPEALWLELGVHELPYDLEQMLAVSLESAIKTALEEVLGVELEMGGD